jgi:proteasome lid subunit RPN8/RPN11
MVANFVLGIDSKFVEQIRNHGVETYPHECCGALLGREVEAPQTGAAGREVLGLYPLVNRRDDSPRNRFSVSSEDVRDAEKAARAQNFDVIGWYHSHPDHPAKPSLYDQEHAWPWYSYIIVSVMNARAQDMTSWRLNDDRTEFLPESIEIRESARI